MIEQDTQILCNIQKTLAVEPNATQRTLAQKSNISLGQMNAVLKRCAGRGWISIKNLNMKKVCYYLTSEGLEEVSRRTFGYMKKNFDMMNQYAVKLHNRIEKEVLNGKENVILIGDSQIEFIIDWACNKNKISFYKNLNSKITTKSFVIFGENYKHNMNELKKIDAINVLEII